METWNIKRSGQWHAQYFKECFEDTIDALDSHLRARICNHASGYNSDCLNTKKEYEYELEALKDALQDLEDHIGFIENHLKHFKLEETA